MLSNFHKVGYYLSMFPNFDWTTQNIKRFKFERTIVVTIIIFYLLLSNILMYFRFSLIYRLSSVSHMTLETLTTILGQLMCVGALTSLVTYESLWMDYFNQVWLLKSTLKLKFDVYKFKLIVVAVALDIFWIVTNAIFIKYIYGAFSHLLYVDIIVHSLYHLTCSYFIVNVVKFTRQCLAQTNKVLQQRLLSATNDLPAKIRHITIIYEDIRTLNKIFEDLFGWRMLLMIVGAGLIMLNTFNFLLQLLLTSENVLIIATTLLIGLFGVSSSVWVMQECDATANEGQTIATTALKYEKNFPLNSEERRELMRLAGCVMHRKIAFTAAGFFGVNRRNIFALFGTATTYFIILIQLMNV